MSAGTARITRLNGSLVGPTLPAASTTRTRTGVVPAGRADPFGNWKTPVPEAVVEATTAPFGPIQSTRPSGAAVPTIRGLRASVIPSPAVPVSSRGRSEGGAGLGGGVARIVSVSGPLAGLRFPAASTATTVRT